MKINVYVIFFTFFAHIHFISAQSDSLKRKRIQLIMAKDDTTKIRLLNELAESMLTSNLTQAQTNLKIAEALLRNKRLPQLQARTLTNLGLYYIMDNRIDSAKNTIQKVLQLAPQLPDATYIIVAINRMGNIYYQRKNYEQAIFYFELLQKKSHLLSPVEKFELFNNLAKVQRDLGNYLAAMNFYVKALEIYDEEALTLESKVISLHEIGALHAFLNDTTKALNYFRRSSILSEEKGSILYKAINQEEIGKILLAKNESSRSLHSLEQAFMFYKDIDYLKGMSSSLYYIGKAYFKKELYHYAQETLLSSLSLARKNLFKHIVCYDLNLLSRLAYLNLNPKEADQYAEEALSIAQSINSKELIKESAYQLLIIKEELGEYEEAVRFAKLHQLYQDSLLNEGDFRKQEALKYNYELQKQEARKRAELALKDVEIKEQYLFITFMIITAVLLALLTLILILGNRLLRSQKVELINQHQAVMKLNNLKDKLFSIISHDLKSPLLSLKELAATYKNHHWTEDQMNEFFTIFFQHFGQTVDLLENLLQWTKSQMSGINISTEKIELNDIIDKEIDVLYPFANRKGIQLEKTISFSIPLYSDQQMLSSVIRNLIHNAIKFCEDGDSIWVNAKAFENHIEVSVVDTGMGMDAKTRANLFKLEKYTTPGTRLELGTGLGLMICKEFIFQLGGNIWAESTLGEGSVFYFTIPIRPSMMPIKSAKTNYMLPKQEQKS